MSLEQYPIVSVISIHALREEGDLSPAPKINARTIFLSTPSARRATLPLEGSLMDYMDFYPRPPRGGRRVQRQFDVLAPFISIHALREEGDLW